MNPSGDGSPHADAADAALEGDASGSVIRGAAARGGTYVLSTGLIALAFLLVLRDLGVDEFGRLSAALAVAAIVQSVGEAAISAVAQRLLVGSPAQDRPRLAAQFVGLRLVLMPLASLLGIAFAVAAGYPPRQLAAVALACLGAVLTVTAAAWTVSLQIELRAARASVVELVRQVVVAVGLATVALAGAGLVAYSAVYVVAGLLAVVVALRLVAPVWRHVRLPTRSTVVLVVREATWLAVAVTVNSLFLKLLTVVASVAASDEQTGVFATAARLVEVIAGLPLLMAAVAFPVLSRAAEQGDDARLASAVDRVVRGVVLLIGVVVVVVAVAARPIVAVFAGEGYEAAAPVLQLQVFALLASTITQGLVWALVALRGERVLMVTNVVGLVLLLTIGTAAARLDGARGLAVAAVVGESLLLLLTLLALRRVGRHAVPKLGPLAGVVAAAVASATVGLLAPFGDVVGAALGVVVFLVVVLACRLVPLDALAALRRRT